MRKIGYIRVSTRDQCPDRQIDALAAICDELHIEKLSAATLKRPIYRAAVKKLKAGDSLIIHDLDRAYRSTLDALNELEKLTTRGVFIRILAFHLDTSSPHGEYVYTLMAAQARYDRRMISVRTKEGLTAAKLRGRKLGRPRKLNDTQLAEARLRLQRDEPKAAIAADYDVVPLTLSRSLSRV